MKRSEKHILKFAGLKDGNHVFSYEINNRFFHHFNFNDFNKSSFKIDINLEKKATVLDLKINSKGLVNVDCSVSNEPFDYELNSKLDLIVKFGEFYDDSNEELIDGYISTTKKAQTDMINTMNKIYELLKKNNIKMSVLIYPWPQQLINNVQESNHEKMWSDFCLNKCENFFNLFPIYKQKLENSNFIEVYKKYYFWNDVHFNTKGNRIIAQRLIKEF